jgi:hypothetical protein
MAVSQQTAGEDAAYFSHPDDYCWLIDVHGRNGSAGKKTAGASPPAGFQASLIVYVLGMDQPSRDQPEIPDGYGVPDTDQGVLEWSAVEDRLVRSSHYWMATTRSDGTPHVVPRWGVWMDGRFWYDGAVDTVHVRNLTENSACVLHLEDGRQAVIVEGRSERAHPPGLELGGRLAAVFSAKYAELGYSPEPGSWQGPDAGGLRVFTPHKAMAWFDFPSDVTRFRF